MRACVCVYSDCSDEEKRQKHACGRGAPRAHACLCVRGGLQRWGDTHVHVSECVHSEENTGAA